MQRAALATVLMMKPSLIIADEPTTALDILTGERIMDLLADLQKEAGCAVLFISHDLTHILKRTQRLGVMYGGRLMETGRTEVIRNRSQHPYTRLLLQSKPTLKKQMPEKLTSIPGEPGAVAREGCPFLLRCPRKSDGCRDIPAMKSLGDGHRFACHHPDSERGDALDAAVGDQPPI
ncbi:oligopeptide/dipeptide ABC transporter ATP-binding protein [Paludifilum halophilum]|uniref:Oligopeptide/dipeptide ABC transporter C-terminal domain-containing protein n=1 Tax=Paludifilum halophilum TaxID=1642702 RepID=A0A235B507_9BACL|nr:oligopeptide/dipeptide ABC transporter ATP-binding protein [Paludifilum halophilum]OYD07322.1 hypothetical protein CHM34_10420 [Paludifilum halophilum]